MNKTIRTALATFAVVAISSTFIYSTTSGTSAQNNAQNDPEIKMLEQLKIQQSPHFFPTPLTADFAGEKVPLDILDVKERFDREIISNTNLHGSTILTLKRAQRYFPVIEPILKKHGIPDDFKYLCVIESSLSNAVSPAGASGFWQFMKGTAKDYGLLVDESIDQRYDLELATNKACEYFKDAKDRFGSWTLVAAAYNRGMAGIQRALDTQYVDNYYDLFLNQETSRYVFRILALKEIMNNTDKYGFTIPYNAKYHPVQTNKITVDYDIDDLAKWAKDQGINYKLLKLYNPWLVNTSLKVKGKSYQIEIPTQGI
ncbi:lytic transglycosylase domain-containing protein [Myroides sp. LJL119]